MMMTYNASLLAQADLLLLLTEAISANVSATRLAALQPAQADELLRAAGLGDDSDLAQALASLLDAAGSHEPDEVAHEYHRLFEGAMVSPLNETAFVRRDKGAVIGDLCGFYRAFGFEQLASNGEKPDHLACQLQFVALLLVMAASAEASKHDEHLAVTNQALRHFADAHLSQWLLPACAWLRGCGGIGYFGAMAGVLASLWQAICRVHGWPSGSEADLQPPQSEPDSPYDCIVGPTNELVDLTIAATPA